MSIVQKIEYRSEFDYFDGFLQYAIDECGVDGSVSRDGNKIELILSESNPEALERFSQYTQKYLPHSIYLGKIDTVRDSKMPKEGHFLTHAYPIAPCPLCIEELTNPASDRYLDDTLKCTHYCNSEVYEDIDYTYFSPHFNNHDTILLCDASKVKELFILTDEEIRVLFSIEKPTIKATIKSQELKELTGKNYIRLKAPYNIKSSLVALNAKESEIDTLFFNERDNEPFVVCVQEYIYMVNDNRVSSRLQDLDSNKQINRLLNIKNEAKYQKVIGAYLSQKLGVSFLISDEVSNQVVMSFGSFDMNRVLESMQNDETKSRLLQNFGNKFGDRLERLKNLNSNDIFEALSIILGLQEVGFEAISDKSLEFRGNGGLKIDMNFKDDGFVYEDMLGSVMSFALADTDSAYLAYSIFEAYGDMTISVLGQLKGRFKIDKFILMGDYFANSVLFSRILSKFQISKPYFSTTIALDY